MAVVAVAAVAVHPATTGACRAVAAGDDYWPRALHVLAGPPCDWWPTEEHHHHHHPIYSTTDCRGSLNAGAVVHLVHPMATDSRASMGMDCWWVACPLAHSTTMAVVHQVPATVVAVSSGWAAYYSTRPTYPCLGPCPCPNCWASTTTTKTRLAVRPAAPLEPLLLGPGPPSPCSPPPCVPPTHSHSPDTMAPWACPDVHPEAHPTDFQGASRYQAVALGASCTPLPPHSPHTDGTDTANG